MDIARCQARDRLIDYQYTVGGWHSTASSGSFRGIRAPLGRVLRVKLYAVYNRLVASHVIVRTVPDRRTVVTSSVRRPKVH